MKLIADSGSTKTDWALLGSDGVSCGFTTTGINPVVLDRNVMENLLKSELLPRVPDTSAVKEVRFYGAGCTPSQSPVVKALLETLFPSARVVVDSDLMGAAIALCGDSLGIACILGTGSNSCLFDGERILQNTPALGYILGDEGSGAVLGRLFLNALLKGQLPQQLRDEFLREYSLTLPIIINKVYREALANRFLASISPFVAKHIENQVVEGVVVANFRSFLNINVRPYFRDALAAIHDEELCVNFVGSMASCYEPQLRKALELEGMKMGKIMKSPIEGLKKYFF